jgi:hypothetical protein
MALWGKADSLFSPGTVTVNYATKTIVGTGTSFRAAGISTGTVITIGVGGTFGQAVISGVTSERQVSIATTQYLTGKVISGVGYTLSQKPIYSLEDINYSGIQTSSTKQKNAIYGVDQYEQAAVNATGLGTYPSKYHSAHAGWVGIHTYVDMHGNYRVKSETLVAFSGIATGTATYTSTGDASDDITYYPDVYISISSQPSNRVGILTTANTTFAVTAASVPAGTVLGYQWQYSSTGVAYTDLTNGGIYSNVATATVGIASTTVTANRPNGYYYRVGISSTNLTTAYSTPATLTYA